MTKAFAPAKINLTLHVTGQRPDGYHLLDSLVVFADVGDQLVLTPGSALTIEVSGAFAAGVPLDARNLVWRAAVAAGWTGRIVLEKNLPHGAGLGGGSADAAAVLRSLFGDDVRSGIGLDAALALGADVPVCLSSAPQRMSGIGERLERVWPVPQLDLVLVNPGIHVATPEVFRALAWRDNPGMERCDGWSDRQNFVNWLAIQSNDLEPAACTAAPTITRALDALAGAQVARMSGSGATCFGLYRSAAAAQDAARQIGAQHPDWWVVATRTVGVGCASA
ncbi:4-(cytidine 5'-diphospho)-2-C-methyl-D-erythritol kinase [Puniceibacterium sp. IMCC21224]|uniref:4-(cytidine 5'-diphospho)-2-C-methyl-D-erythritol kinase n=1 Tax=Puniceibacterium sp. IMCC21224 TaxID=1618204 RepID=UPI00064DE4BD|nr:4-(cytidine 5'-diphospho)-2-C-methyl-D-erythritol kinase [Puniceibacterium sp. IMCC21224]